ncbi:gp5 C-terminal domain protein, partial [Vibrio parahaemolyticus V-223/04]
LLIPAHK